MGWSTFSEAIKMYTALYCFNQIMSRKWDASSFEETMRSILRSSFFLGFNAYSVILIFCLSRRLLGKFYYVLAAHLPATFGSYLSIMLERRSRRPALSFYVANVASETVWRKIVNKGWIRPIPNGEVVIFAASTASLLYLLHRNGFGKDPVSFAFRFLLGKEFVRGDQVRPTFPIQRESQVTRRSMTPSTDISLTPAVKTNPTFSTNDVINIETSGSGLTTDETGDDHEVQQTNGRKGRKGGDEKQINVQSFTEHHDHQQYNHRKHLINRPGIISCCGHLLPSIHGTENRTILSSYSLPSQSREERDGEEKKALESLAQIVPFDTSDVSEEYHGGLTLSTTTTPFPVTRESLVTSLPPLHSYHMSHVLTLHCLTEGMLGFLRNFLIGYVGQSLMTLASQHQQLLLGSPVTAVHKSFLQNKKSLQLGLFLGSFTAVFKISHCLLRNLLSTQGIGENGSSQFILPHLLRKLMPDLSSITFMSGLLASSSMLFYPSPTTAQYMLWKLIETVYFLGVKSGRVKYVDFTLNMLYAVSTAQLFYVAVMEPKMMRKSYTKWLNRVTRGSFALLNRNIIDIFGTESSYGYGYHEPALQLAHTSEKFKESVLVWMI